MLKRINANCGTDLNPFLYLNLIWNSLAIVKLLVFALPFLSFLFVDQRTFSELDLSPSALAYSFWDTSKGPLP